VSPSVVRALHIPCSGHAPRSGSGGDDCDAAPHAHGMAGAPHTHIRGGDDAAAADEGTPFPHDDDDDGDESEDDAAGGGRGRRAQALAPFVRALAQARPWVRELLDSDSGPFAAVPTETCASLAVLPSHPPLSLLTDGAATAAEGEKGTPAAAFLPGPALRRRDFLLRVLVDQYGPGNVVYRGPDAAAVAADIPGLVPVHYDAPLQTGVTGADAAAPTLAEPLALVTPPPSCAIDIFLDGSAARLAFGHPPAQQGEPALAPARPCWHLIEASLAGFTGLYDRNVTALLGATTAASSDAEGTTLADAGSHAASGTWVLSVSDDPDVPAEPLRFADAKMTASLARTLALADALFLPVTGGTTNSSSRGDTLA
jgi:hypothetical protein